MISLDLLCLLIVVLWSNGYNLLIWIASVNTKILELISYTGFVDSYPFYDYKPFSLILPFQRFPKNPYSNCPIIFVLQRLKMNKYELNMVHCIRKKKCNQFRKEERQKCINTWKWIKKNYKNW